MKLRELSAALSPTEVVGDDSVEIADLAYAAGAVRPGALFFCVPGSRADGHDFAAAAVERGAAALVVERQVPVAVPQIVVEETRAAMPGAAAAFFGYPTRELEVAGVTGTTGKTTTTYLLYAILEAAGRRPGLMGTVESRIGGERKPAVRTTPEAIDLQRAFRAMLDAGDRSVALEATSHGSELGRLAGIRFAALAFTNLSEEHLDFHGTMERYYAAKRRLFVGPEPPPAAVNVGDAYGRELADELRALGRAPLLTFGFADDAEIRPDGLEHGRLRAGSIELETRLRGRFNVENVLAAVSVALLLDVEDEAIAEGIARVEGVPGRFETIDEGQPFTVVVDYSHKPGALENVLRTARDLATGRVLCVFGCGGDRDRTKRPLMGRIAADLADVAIVTSDNPRSEDPDAIIDEVVAGAPGRLEVEPDRAKAIGQALEGAQAGDVVVIAGKGHEQGQELDGRVVPFDDRDVARETLRALGARA
ncbi:MAG TPA: UDP-N-acetylmuramoyl-L-alanyl-D-glutamate--2,6-diaminopimelate ligase [Gaiellaceae bacterium]|nr:UDP-N-acetylmuramoyl-L-alanyl-D-glutamate--2,6-diaminopimelate ligase [Gaiellaceae bacterium]